MRQPRTRQSHSATQHHVGCSMLTRQKVLSTQIPTITITLPPPNPLTVTQTQPVQSTLSLLHPSMSLSVYFSPHYQREHESRRHASRTVFDSLPPPCLHPAPNPPASPSLRANSRPCSHEKGDELGLVACQDVYHEERRQALCDLRPLCLGVRMMIII